MNPLTILAFKETTADNVAVTTLMKHVHSVQKLSSKKYYLTLEFFLSMNSMQAHHHTSTTWNWLMRIQIVRRLCGRRSIKRVEQTMGGTK